MAEGRYGRKAFAFESDTTLSAALGRVNDSGVGKHNSTDQTVKWEWTEILSRNRQTTEADY